MITRKSPLSAKITCYCKSVKMMAINYKKYLTNKEAKASPWKWWHFQGGLLQWISRIYKISCTWEFITRLGCPLLTVRIWDFRQIKWWILLHQKQKIWQKFNFVHLGAMYDPISKVYVNASVQPKNGMNEHKALISMVRPVRNQRECNCNHGSGIWVIRKTNY